MLGKSILHQYGFATTQCMIDKISIIRYSIVHYYLLEVLQWLSQMIKNQGRPN